MKISRRHALRALGAAAFLPLLDACHGLSGAAPLIIGSKDFTEEQLLGEMYAQVLEERGLPVHRRLGLGGTQVAMAALQRGSIGLYPEYTGTALTVELRHAPVIDGRTAYEIVAREYQRRFHLTWLHAAPLNDTQAIAMTPLRAAALGIRTVSDFAKNAARVRLAAVPEFLERPDGLPGLEQRYGPLRFAEIHALDSGLKYQALAHGDVDAVVAFSTDGRLETDHLLVLADDRHIWDEYHPAPVVRNDILKQYPRIPEYLNALAPTLTSTVMRHLNALVDGEKREIADVARTHLQATGLIRRG